jgi:hypothetical protein
MPPFPTQPSRADYREAARTVRGRFGWPGTSTVHADPLGGIACIARDLMRTRHARTPVYQAFLAHAETQRRAAGAAEDAERARRDRAKTAREWTEEFTHYEAGGTEAEWDALQAAKQQAATAKHRRTAQSRSK